MIKLVVSDLDGTLLKYEEQEICKPIKKRIRLLLDKGVKFAVASGRDFADLAPLFEEFGDEIYFISADGAYYLYKGNSLYERKIDMSDIRGAVRQCPDAPFILRGKSNSYALGIPPKTELYPDTKFIGSLNEIPSSEKIFKLIKFSSPLRLPKDSGIRLHWDGRNLGHFEYVSRYANKGAALSDLQNRLMLSTMDTAAIGDGPNDIHLFRGAKLKISVGNRCEELRSLATKEAICGIGALSMILDEVSPRGTD